MKKLSTFLLLLVLLSGCSAPHHGGSGSASSGSSTPPPADVSQPLPPPAQSEAPQPPSPPVDEKQALLSGLLSSMTLEEKVGQLFFARCPETGAADKAAQFHLGGYLLFARDFQSKTPDQVRQDIAAYQAASPIPMLIGVDEEGGSVVRVSRNPLLRTEKFLSPQKLYAQGGMDAILADAREKDALLSSLGINVNFAPVADLSTDPKDFIYPRTFGGDAEGTSAYISAVTAQMAQDHMGAVLKHFPGYGNNADTHTGVAIDPRPQEQFVTADYLPFRAGIQAGAGAVLVCHNVIQWLGDGLPASLSPAAHRQLREELGFEGVALTDDLAMEAVGSYVREGSAAVMALQAGNDMIMTTDFEGEIPQVLAALEDGTLSLDTVDRAAERVLGWKYDLGLL